MFFIQIFLLPLVLVSTSSDVTFQKVEFNAYSVHVLKFSTTIQKSDTLKENLPREEFDRLEFLNQNIPVLRENSVSDIDSLDELTIENCKLKDIRAGAFRNLPALRRLDLKGNDLEEIAAGVFNNLPLSALDLSKNRIKNIEATALDNLPNVLNINVADNLIETWNKRWFRNTPLLTTISMQNNSLETIPKDAFTNLKGYKKYGSVKLTINLVFSHNKIHKIEDGAFTGLEEINNLWLDHNQLSEFRENTLEKVKVQDLRIEYNQLNCLTGDLREILKAEINHIDGNPFDCECLAKIKKWATENEKNVEMFFSEMNCSADRMRRKMDDLEKRLKEIKVDKEREETTSASSKPTDDVEVLFK